MTQLHLFAIICVGTIGSQLIAEDWTKESKDRSKRAALHDAAQLVRGDAGRWSDKVQLVNAPAISNKPAKLTLDGWVDELQVKSHAAKTLGEHWLLIRT